jgi:hypothetical protein
MDHENEIKRLWERLVALEESHRKLIAKAAEHGIHFTEDKLEEIQPIES